MSDVVLDTNVLADFLAQFFGSARRGRGPFTRQNTITPELARKINQIVHWHDWDSELEDYQARYPGQVIAATFAFVEIARQWTDIARERFTVEQMAGFIEQPPEWFVIEPVDENLVEAFCDVPTDIRTAQGKMRSLEWPDAIHIAVAFGRGNDCLLAATDREIRQIEVLQNRLI